MYAAILQMTFPPERRDEVVAFLRDEMTPVIRDNPGFLDFRVLESDTPGTLTMIDTWESRSDSAAAGGTAAAVAVHTRFDDLGLAVAAATRYTVVSHS